jgi:hypothetical protein
VVCGLGPAFGPAWGAGMDRGPARARHQLTP